MSTWLAIVSHGRGRGEKKHIGLSGLGRFAALSTSTTKSLVRGSFNTILGITSTGESAPSQKRLKD